MAEADNASAANGEVDFEGLALEKLNGKTKPLGAFGTLELWAVRLCVIQKTLTPRLDRVAVCVFAADHGVAAAHPVSAYPSSVTAAVFKSIAAGLAGVNVLARQAGAVVDLVDVGLAVEGPVQLSRTAHDVTVHNLRIRDGSGDIVRGPAMTGRELDEALEVGGRIAGAAAAAGAAALCVGEIGIGNTTVAAALLAALTGSDPERTTGRGSGVDDAGWQKKCDAVRAALARCAEAALPVSGDSGDGSRDGPAAPLHAKTLLCELGGLEVAAMVGAMVRASEAGMVVLVDGFICGVAALAAASIHPPVTAHMLLTHESAEAGAPLLGLALQERGCCAAPPLRMGLRLGEGTGALLAVPLLRSACAVMTEMGTLAETLAL